jgi:hypothetical protein
MSKLLNLIEMSLQFLVCKVYTELLKTIQYKKISDVGIETLQIFFFFLKICKVYTELLKTIQYKKISDVGIETLQIIFKFNGLPIMLKTLKPVYIKDTN